MPASFHRAKAVVAVGIVAVIGAAIVLRAAALGEELGSSYGWGLLRATTLGLGLGVLVNLYAAQAAVASYVRWKLPARRIYMALTLGLCAGIVATLRIDAVARVVTGVAAPSGEPIRDALSGELLMTWYSALIVAAYMSGSMLVEAKRAFRRAANHSA